ncbi:hypothetical protein HBH47_082000 [Parastagonospora nodorum]|nr:hypothetical protein HBH47_082000 [Parastagonospora nodorum]KAH5078479.1 hypothetical protein HBH95_096570 [Parastagonospora nodorum]KAH5385237.1 hypothetical protein HBI33_086880 [Parastagonospora nodorum]KAH5541026.1 hypothetical protein HBI27_098370 [Parastagonospora nodorum]KAH6296911.1 hypothetical protein HBI39_151880 [Parastagonospora nodorum]
MSGRGQGNQRGGGRGGARGGRGGMPNGNASNGNHAPKPPQPQLEQQFESMSLTGKLAVDGSPLVMDSPVHIPRPNPMPGNKVDPKAFQDIQKGLKASGLQAEFPLRQGLANPTTTVYTNHFAIKLDPVTPLYEYIITGLPSRVGNRTTRKLISEAIDDIDCMKNNRDKFVIDYKLMRLVSWVDIDIPSMYGSARTSEWRDPVLVTFERLGKVNTDLLIQYSAGKLAPTAEVEEEVKRVSGVLNMVVSTSLSRGSFSLKANKFFVTGGHNNLSPSLCTIRGYYYSIRPAMGQIVLELSGCTSAFYKPILVSDFLQDTTTFKYQSERLAKLRNLRVQLTYDPVHSGTKPRSAAATIEARIKTIAGTGLPVSEQKFTLKGRDGKPDTKITVQSHFERTYQSPPLNPKMPAINCGTDTAPKWYLPEKLQILPYQIHKRKVPEALTSEMLDIALHHPDTTRALIEHECLAKLGLRPGESLKPFPAFPAIKIDSRMLQVPATTLNPPKPLYGKGSASVSNGSWNLRDVKFLTTFPKIAFKVFMIAIPDGSHSAIKGPEILHETFKGFQDVMQRSYSTATIQCVGMCPDPQFDRGEAEARISMEKAKDKGANFVMLFLEKENTPAYSVFKYLADCMYGMHSLCVVYKGKPFSPQYWGNIAMKMNLKAGGINHSVDGVEQIMKDTLVLGADCTHPESNSLAGTPSIAAIVGSVDAKGGKFLGSMRLQPRLIACEDIQDVESMVVERLMAWFMANKRTLPKNILYYRDGVSDTQYSQVKDRELPQIRKAFAAFAKKLGLMQVPKFKLTAYVVAKRHHVRMFPLAADAAPKNGNCRPGTVVDSGITSPYFGDFYMQSHNGLIGTARSAHYFPLVNEMGLTDVQIQLFTHRLCYTYVRASMGVSYAPPAFYADRLCDRGRCYLRKFFAPPPSYNPLSQFEANLTREKRIAREAQFTSKRVTKNVNGKTWTQKSELEHIQEELDKEAVADTLKQMTFDKAKEMFYKGGDRKNPWHENVAGTMFWM